MWVVSAIHHSCGIHLQQLGFVEYTSRLPATAVEAESWLTSILLERILLPKHLARYFFPSLSAVVYIVVGGAFDFGPVRIPG